MDGKKRKLQAAKNQLVERLSSVITESAEDILSRTLSKLSESPEAFAEWKRPYSGEAVRPEAFARCIYTWCAWSGETTHLWMWPWLYVFITLCVATFSWPHFYSVGDDASCSGLQALARGSALVRSKLKHSSGKVGRTKKTTVCLIPLLIGVVTSSVLNR